MSCRPDSRALRLACAAMILCADGWRAGATAQTVPRIEAAIGFTLERELPPGATDRYTLTLIAGQFIDFVVTGAGGAAVSLAAPAGAVRGRISRETTPDGAKRVCEVAEQSGTYVVTVAPRATEALADYQLRVSEVRPADETDRAGARASASEGRSGR